MFEQEIITIAKILRDSRRMNANSRTLNPPQKHFAEGLFSGVPKLEPLKGTPEAKPQRSLSEIRGFVAKHSWPLSSYQTPPLLEVTDSGDEHYVVRPNINPEREARGHLEKSHKFYMGIPPARIIELANGDFGLIRPNPEDIVIRDII